MAAGNADSAEGVALDELSMRAGPARLLLQGSLLCPKQEASLHVTDFPLDLLQVYMQGLRYQFALELL